MNTPSSTSIYLREVKTKSDLRKFIFLPGRIHRNHLNYVPPLLADEWSFYDPEKNHGFRHCSTIMFLCFRDKEPVGRIMGIINHSYNEKHHEKKARIFALEWYDDEEVALALTGAAENWAAGLGMETIAGPFGFSDKDPQGFMTEGFENPMIIATNCNLPYMNRLIEKCGYTKEVDLLEYSLPVPGTIPDFYRAIYERSSRMKGLHLLEFHSRKEIKPYIWPVFELINNTYGHIYGFSEMTAEEVRYTVGRYMPVIHPRFVKIILDQNRKVAAFALAIPEISEGIRKAHGRLYPFGIFSILKASRKTRMLTMLLGAVRNDLRNNGLDVLLGMKIIESASDLRYQTIDSHLVLEHNVKMLAEYEKLGGKISKRYRIYSKAL